MKHPSEQCENPDGSRNRNVVEELAELRRSAEQLRRTETAIRKVMTNDSAMSGPGFLDHMTRELAHVVKADFTLIGEVVGKSRNAIQTMSFFGEGRHQDNFRYDLLNTPCERYSSNESCCYPANVLDLFPQDLRLKGMGIDGYIGIPLHGSSGTPLGILVALYLQPAQEPEFALSILQLFSSRIAGEMERIKGEKRLRQQMRLDQMIADLSTRFIRVPHTELDQVIDQALAMIGEFVGADRCVYFRIP